MASLAQLRKQAKEMGIAPSVIRGAETADELQAEIENFSEKKSGGTTTVVRKKSGTVAKKKTATGGSTTKKSSAKKTAVKSKPAAKKSAKSGEAKRSTSRKSSKASTAKRNSDAGRNLLDGVDYGSTDGWNARSGSAPDRIIKALKKYRGNREKVFDSLESDVWDFVGKKKVNGDKRTKAEALDMLRYRIARTAWDFAVRTGQHSKAENRVEYGTGGTGQGTWKPANARRSTAKKSSSKKTTARKTSTKKKSAGRKKSASRR